MSNNKEFEDSLKNAEEQIIKEVINNMNKACFIIEAEAKKECPVDLGQLRQSILGEVKISDTEVVGTIGSNIEYALFVHQGTGIYSTDGTGRKTPWLYKDRNGNLIKTKGQNAQPFLQKAIDNNRDKINKILGGVG